jgi:excisionase family DNA binding protein
MSDFENLIFQMRSHRIKGLTVKETSLELGVSVRTVFRMLEDGRLKAEKWKLSQGKGYFWLIDPMSVARIQVRKEIEMEQKIKKEGKQ